NFNGSDSSVILPTMGTLTDALDAFEPEISHAHHPFLLGDTALRAAASRQLPLVFTHHTRYEPHTRYVPGGAPAVREAVINMTLGYCNRCTYVIAPSESVKRLLQRRGVMAPIVVVPTGVEIERFAHGDGGAVRSALGIPAD